MKLREKIFVLAAFLAVVYGAVSWIEKKKKKQVVLNRESQISQVKTQLQAFQLTIDKSKLNPLEKSIVTLSMVSWKQNPFLDKLTPLEQAEKKRLEELEKQRQLDEQKTQQKEELPKVVFNYTGFIQSKNGLMVIINDSEYVTGDSIEDTGYRIEKATIQFVELYHVEAEKSIKVYLQE